MEFLATSSSQYVTDNCDKIYTQKPTSCFTWAEVFNLYLAGAARADRSNVRHMKLNFRSRFTQIL